jgi:hypothetical protein
VREAAQGWLFGVGPAATREGEGGYFAAAGDACEEGRQSTGERLWAVAAAAPLSHRSLPLGCCSAP